VERRSRIWFTKMYALSHLLSDISFRAPSTLPYKEKSNSDCCSVVITLKISLPSVSYLCLPLLPHFICPFFFIWPFHVSHVQFEIYGSSCLFCLFSLLSLAYMCREIWVTQGANFISVNEDRKRSPDTLVS